MSKSPLRSLLIGFGSLFIITVDKQETTDSDTLLSGLVVKLFFFFQSWENFKTKSY